MWGLELVEGQDACPNVRPEFEGLVGKTIEFLVRITKPIWYKRKGDVLVVDSGFCVLEGLIKLCKQGVFAAKMDTW